MAKIALSAPEGLQIGSLSEAYNSDYTLFLDADGDYVLPIVGDDENWLVCGEGDRRFHIYDGDDIPLPLTVVSPQILCISN